MKRHHYLEGDSKEAVKARKNRLARKKQRQKVHVFTRPTPFTLISLAKFIEKDPEIRNARGGVHSLGFRWKPIRKLVRFRKIQQRIANREATEALRP